MFVVCLLLAAAAAWVNRASLERLYYRAIPLPRLAETAAGGNDPEAGLVLAERYLAAGRPADAEGVLRPVLDRNQGLAAGWVLRARSELEQGKDGPAYASANVAAALAGPSAPTLTLLGLIEERRGNENGAEERYRAAIRQDSRSAEAHYRLGRLELSHANYGPAIADLEAARRTRPRDAEIIQYLAQAHQEVGQPQEAQRLAHEAVRLAPSSGAAWFVLGTVLKTDSDPGKRREAESAFGRAEALDPAPARARHELGSLLFQRGEYAAAAAELERAIQSQPLNKPSYPLLAQCYGRLGRPQDSARALREYHRLEEMNLDTAPLEYAIWAMPDNIALRLKLARLYLKYGRRDLAEMQVNLALEANPRNPEALELRARARKSPS